MDVRTLFPHTNHLAYLDHASTGPLSTPVVEALDQYIQRRHRRDPNDYEEMAPMLDRCLSRLAEMIGAPAGRIEFAPNTSYAINVLAQGLDWRPGDRVAVPSCEFPANVMPWLGLGEQGVEVDFIPHENGTLTVEAVEAALRPETHVLALSSVQFLSGFRADLESIGHLCREREVILSVDAIQSLGALRLDLQETPVDFLAAGAQKWLLGMPGTAFFYVSESLQERLKPVRGWMNGPVDFDDLLTYDLTLHDDAERFRLGTLDFAAIVALDAALGVYEDFGMERAEEVILGLAARAADGLSNLGLTRFGSSAPEHASGIVTFEHPAPERLMEAMHERDIRCSIRNRLLRISPTWYNTEEEVDRAVEVAAETL